MMLEPGKVLGERYEIIKKIGAGGMSIVYLAKCNKLQRFVAIKVLRSEFATDEAFVKKFRAEAFSAGSLSHPNIVGIFDVGTEDDLHYIVMEYVEGQTLKELIESQGALPSNIVLEYGIQVVSALRHAHKKQIIHRDIKPQNILVTHDNVLKVADFGIARAVDSSTIVATGNAIGSVHYFSPEQAKGKYVNETSDLYSAGIVLFEMVTGHLPFQAESHVTVALKHINEEIPKPSQFVPDLWAGLEQIILKATNKKQELRYQNADAMLEDMKRVLANPYTRIEAASEESIDQTILLSDVQTHYIRQNEKPLPVEDTTTTHATLSEDFYDEDDAEEEDEPSTLYKVLVSIGGVLAAFVLAGIALFGVFMFMTNEKTPKYVSVPSFEGKTLVVAQKEAKEAKLQVKEVAQEASTDQTPGTIMSQSPKKGEMAKEGDIVEVVIAVEKEVVNKKVIDVLGIDGADAREQLEALGFVVIPDRDYSDTFEMGKVMGQEPKAGEMLEVGEVVTITISKGPKLEIVKVPDVRGKTETDAKLAIKNAGLNVGKITQVTHDTVPAGSVVSQSVKGGTEVEKNTTVELEVSTGPATPEPEEPQEPEDETGGTGETTPEDGNEDTSAPTESTITRIINDPGLGKDSYHVVVMLDNSDGSVPVFDNVLKKEQFPYPFQVTGSGSGTLKIYFDGQEFYQDPIEF